MDRAQVQAALARVKSEAMEAMDSAKAALSRFKDKAKSEQSITITAVAVPVGTQLGVYVSGRFLGPDRKGVSAAIGIALATAGGVAAIILPKYAPYVMGAAAVGGGLMAPTVYDWAVKQREEAQANDSK